MIVATNAYMDAASAGAGRRVLPINSYIIATQPLSQEQQAIIGKQMMVDTKNLLFYWRLTPDGRMAFGGRNRLDPVDIPTARSSSTTTWCASIPNCAASVSNYAWTGYVAMTLDRLPP